MSKLRLVSQAGFGPLLPHNLMIVETKLQLKNARWHTCETAWFAVSSLPWSFSLWIAPTFAASRATWTTLVRTHRVAPMAYVSKAGDKWVEYKSSKTYEIQQHWVWVQPFWTVGNFPDLLCGVQTKSSFRKMAINSPHCFAWGTAVLSLILPSSLRTAFFYFMPD